MSIPDPKHASARLILVLVAFALILTAGSVGTADAQPPCTFTVAPAVIPAFTMNGGPGTPIAVTTSPACAWTNTSSAPWVMFSSGTDRTGTGTVEFSVDGNTGPLARSATLTIAGKKLTISQAACTYTLSAPGQDFPPLGGTGSVNLATGDACAWTNASPVSAPWLTITSAAGPRTGPGAVDYNVASNTTGVARTASLTIAGKPYKVNEATCTYTLSATSAPTGMNPSTGNLLGVTTAAGCPWTNVSSAPWLMIISAPDRVGPGPVSYDVQGNTGPVARTATVTVAGKKLTVTQAACTYTLASAGAAFPPLGGTGSVDLATGDACMWKSTSPATTPWLAITSSLDTRTGPGAVGYSVATNITGAARSSALTIAGKSFKVSEATCTYTLSATSAPIGVNGGPGTLGVGTADGCPWTNISSQPWLTISSGTDRLGAGPVAYAVDPNPAPVARTATVTIAGKKLTVTQAACAFTLASPGAAFPPLGGTGSVDVATGTACTWTNTSPAAAPWLAITSSTGPRTGPGPVTYSVQSNTTGAARTASLTIAGKPYKVSEATCMYALSATAAPFGMNGGDATLNVTTQDGCPWTNVSSAPWVTISSGTDRVGAGPVSYSVQGNTGPVARTASLTMAGKKLSITQAACAYTLAQPGATFPPLGGTGSVDLATGTACTWTNTSGAPWLAITSSTGMRTGPGTVAYSVESNTSGVVRSSTLTIAGKPYKVGEATCTYALSAPTASFPVDGGLGSVTVNTADGCPWTSTSSQSWVSITSAPGTRQGIGAVDYTVAENITPAARSAVLSIAGKTHTVNEAKAASEADLRVTLTLPGDLTTGKIAQAPVKVKNAGGKPAGAFEVGLFVSPTQTPGTGMEVRRSRVNGLNPGQSVDVNMDVSLPANVDSGQYFMSVVADVDRLLVQAPGAHHHVRGPFKVNKGVDKIRDVSASVTVGTAPAALGFSAPMACGLPPSVLTLSGGSTVNDPVFNDDGSITAAGEVNLSGTGASFVGTFTVNVDVNDRATLDFVFATAQVPGFNGTATAKATGSLRASGGGTGGAGAGLGFAFESDVNGFKGTLSQAGCGFTGSFKATVDQIFDLYFLNFLDAGAFGTTGLTPKATIPSPFTDYLPVLSAVDKPFTLPAASQVTFTGPSGSNLNNKPADAFSSVLFQEDGFAVYQTDFVPSTNGPPDGTYTVNYKGARTFNVSGASTRAVVPFPTVTLNAARDLTKVSWSYRNRLTGAPIATPSYIGLFSVLISTITPGNPSAPLSFCSSPFFDRSVTSFTPSLTFECPQVVDWDSVFSIGFIYVDSLSFNAYAVSYDGPRQALAELLVGKVGSGTVTSSPAGINCGATCQGTFNKNAKVTLTATPASGSQFVGWTGACAGAGTSKTCVLTMSTDLGTVASFSVIPSQVRFLNNTCVGSNGVCTSSYTATLTSSIGESHPWLSSTLVPSFYQPVFVPQLNGFTVFLGPPFNQPPITFSGAPFVVTSGRKWTIRFDVAPGPNYFIRLFDTTSSASGVLLHQVPVRPPAASTAPGSPTVTPASP